LSRQTTDEARTGTAQLERQQRVEQELGIRLVSLLEPIVGEGRVRVNVNAKISSDTQEETEERWDPSPVLRSQQVSSQASAGALLPRATGGLVANVPGEQADPAATLPGAGGIAGARSNLPTAAAATATVPADATQQVATVTASTAGGGSASLAETANYEISKVTRHRVQPEGQIARLSVAVVLDDSRAPAADGAGGTGQATPRSAEEIQKIKDLVAAAVGFDQGRGDQLTVENIAFEELPVEEVVPEPIWVRYQPQAFEALRIVGVLLLAVFALFGIVRPLVAGSLASPGALARAVGAPGSAPRTVQDLENELDAQLQAAVDSAAPRRLPVLTRRATALSEKEPENAARLLRAWLTEGER
jgi:flagellar M-ring protein FliF